MRLIDADRLETHEQLEPFGNGNYEYVEVVYKDDIDSAPTIEERKKGRWIEPTPEGCLTHDAKAYSECSECGEKEFLGWRKKFCPNCGADNR